MTCTVCGNPITRTLTEGRSQHNARSACSLACGAKASGVKRRGALNRSALLSEAQVIDIKTLLRDGTPVAEIAGAFGVSKSTIYNIKVGTTWNHVV